MFFVYKIFLYSTIFQEWKPRHVIPFSYIIISTWLASYDLEWTTFLLPSSLLYNYFLYTIFLELKTFVSTRGSKFILLSFSFFTPSPSTQLEIVNHETRICGSYFSTVKTFHYVLAVFLNELFNQLISPLSSKKASDDWFKLHTWKSIIHLINFISTKLKNLLVWCCYCHTRSTVKQLKLIDW